MRGKTLLILTCLTLLQATPEAPVAQFPPALPSTEEVETLWSGFWTALSLGDLRGARTYLHASQRSLFPGKLTVEDLKDLADQMAYCRLDPTPLPTTKEVFYWVHCKHGDETAQRLVSLRRDWDGVWRLYLW